MAVPSATDKTTLKTYFETGDIPTEAQFAAFIDSVYNMSEGLGEKLTFNNSVSIVIPAERELVGLHIWADTTQNITVGDTLGAGEYMDDLVQANVPFRLDLGLFVISQKTIYIQGTGTINVKYYIK